jgi:hypothetical protein
LFDVQRVGAQGTGEVEPRVHTFVQQKAAESARGEVDGPADDLAAVVEAQGLGRLAGEVDRLEAALVQQIAVAAAAGVLVVTQDLSARVDLER